MQTQTAGTCGRCGGPLTLRTMPVGLSRPRPSRFIRQAGRWAGIAFLVNLCLLAVIPELAAVLLLLCVPVLALAAGSSVRSSLSDEYRHTVYVASCPACDRP